MVAVIKSTGLPSQADFHAAISSRSDRWYSACLRITRSPELAEDAVQEALLSAWDKRHQFNHSARLETWIHRIAVNAALQLLRKNRPGMFEPLESEVLDPAETPEEAQRSRELDNELAAAFVHLSDTERVCFVLKHLEQWRLSEIADEFAINIGTVKQAIFRAVRKLRGHMSDLKGVDDD
jgi:RNA polymerase sigma-70 factor (ECF subfamily)